MKTSLSILALALALMLLGGCNPVSHKRIARNLTPELRGLAMRPADAYNARKVQENQNWRMFSDDLARAAYTDHPSRLSPYPVNYTSGQPR